MKEFNLTYLAQYFNHILGEDDFEIKAFVNNYVKDDKVKGTVQGTIYPVFAKGISALSSSLQITFEVPCDNDLQFQRYISKIQSLCGESRFNIDATWNTEIDGTGESGGSIYNCYSQLQLEYPLTEPQESNGIIVLIVQLTGAIRITKESGNELLIGYDVETNLSLYEYFEGENLSIISIGVKTVKEGASDTAETLNTKIPYFTAQNTFYTIDFYYTGSFIEDRILKHIEKKKVDVDDDYEEEMELYVYLTRKYPNGIEIKHKCMVLSDSQIIESPSTYTHIILNLQTVD